MDTAFDIRSLYGQGRPAVSFELFPPKTPEGMESLFDQLQELVRCKPSFITCTYGAGGSTRDRTLDVLRAIRERHPQMPVVSHLTCSGASRDGIRAYIRSALDLGVSGVVALRGDPPKDAPGAEEPSEFRHASDLVELIRAEFPALAVLVAGYPETHPESPSVAADIEHLKRKVDAGADVVVTQLFFDNQDYFRFRDRCADAGISAPIVPGILPVTNLAQIRRLTAMCGAHLPGRLLRRLEVHQDDEEGQYAVGVYHAARQAEELIAGGAPGMHFYVLNKSRAALLICRALALFTPVE
ncbi:MAG TPA: methylenetetrahydrofolate reductase [NAD(P)H] [Candidatus Hydrogenedentes bacterium]|nr:methylenetetrahydrofolate reductase [NAD(P)H] [Candidatus Hydrogenedentota bacterium]HOC71222.1 methylenetetrahydrofolate reductase [NAD(P)H] [Candidatus Hydrogenedentota bacterium]HOH49170.1 methylenetetrahydrofolate reductase [NAD(P)H] [Candidatus Hydrogenedentota bacterium]HPA40738.1 methylenetetrahydrofolate reductase [NAD(P)H] [Candidatus Hydrogenedentota bacterium]HQL93404.1 methylenetetrahydrofolate reductase [NAD(P)H] [Candidatus Hydrogenedentota bacterium]